MHTLTLSGLRRRPEVYDLYWIFAARRQLAFERRLAGYQKPWTEDPIIERYKFCNVFRAADRVSQYLIQHVIYDRTNQNPSDLLFRIIAFRMFSHPETWISVTAKLGGAPTLNDLRSGGFEKALKEVKRETGRLYTGAFILCANKAYGFDEKYRNHVALFREMFLKRNAAKTILEAKSLKQVVEQLLTYPLLGQFMSYQLAIDLNYSDLLSFDENEYTQAGPGALRGIRKAFLDVGELKPAAVIRYMVDQQEEEFARLGLKFGGLFGRPLHAIDCQGLFCEFDKYCREAAPHLISNRSRIKARFQPSASPLHLFFPPKWGLNARISKLWPRAVAEYAQETARHKIALQFELSV